MLNWRCHHRYIDMLKQLNVWKRKCQLMDKRVKVKLYKLFPIFIRNNNEQINKIKLVSILISISKLLDLLFSFLFPPLSVFWFHNKFLIFIQFICNEKCINIKVVSIFCLSNNHFEKSFFLSSVFRIHQLALTGQQFPKAGKKKRF